MDTAFQFDYRDSDHPRPCVDCGRFLRRTFALRCEACETGAEPVARERKLHDWEPVAVVVPARMVKQPQTVWYDAATPGNRTKQLHLAYRLASLTHGRVEIL